MLGLLAVAAGALLLHDHYGTPLGRFDARQYAAFYRLNAYSVAALSILIALGLVRVALKERRRTP
jgi:hypothetical protein